MRTLHEVVRRDPGRALLALAMLLVVVLYAPTAGHGLVNFDDPWLIRDNWLLQQPSGATLHAILFDLSRDTRAVLGAEYLPVRDLSIVVDVSLWGTWWAGYHLTNVAVYLATLPLWFAALTRLGVDRRLVGLAVLLWAVHPTHAESVAWLSERKGVLAMMFAGAAALGHARFRSGGRGWWLALAAVAGVAAVWSKATSAFALASLVGLELALPTLRRSWSRSLVSLAAVGVAAGFAFAPVLLVASRMEVVGTVTSTEGWTETVLGVLGFYVRLVAMAVPNAISYPISHQGPSTVDLALGGVAMLAVLACVAVPRRGWWQPSPTVRAAAVVWLFGWFPVSRILLPVKAVLVADRYMLLPTLGVALGVAAAVLALPRARTRNALAGVLVLAASLRTLDARASWQDATQLWSRAVESNPHDSDAWSMLVEALEAEGQDDLAHRTLVQAKVVAPSPRLTLREALRVLPLDRALGVELMRSAAVGGEPRAMANLAMLLLEDGVPTEALTWARTAVALSPLYASGHRIHGRAAIAGRLLDEAHAAFARALALEPLNPANQLNLALVLIELGRPAEARPLLERCRADARFAAQAAALLAKLP